MKFALSLYLLIAATISFLCCGGCNEVQKKHFDTLAAASQEHLIEKGWIPAFIPSDAKDINFESDLDSSNVYGSYVSANTEMLRKRCLSAGDSFRVPGYVPKWFRSDLKEGDTAGKLRSKGYEVFHCDEGSFEVAIFGSRNYVYYWSIRK